MCTHKHLAFLTLPIGEGHVWCKQRQVFAFLFVFLDWIGRRRRLGSRAATDDSSRLRDRSFWGGGGAAWWYMPGKAHRLKPSEVRWRDRLSCCCLFLLDGLFEILDRCGVRSLHTRACWQSRSG